MPTDRIMVQPPIEVDQGYYEFRVNWSGEALLAMSGEQLEEFKAAMATLERLGRGGNVTGVCRVAGGPL